MLAAADHLPAALIARGIFSPPLWDSSPIALDLAVATSSFPGDASWAAPARVAIEALAKKVRSREILSLSLSLYIYIYIYTYI